MWEYKVVPSLQSVRQFQNKILPQNVLVVGGPQNTPGGVLQVTTEINYRQGMVQQYEAKPFTDNIFIILNTRHILINIIYSFLIAKMTDQREIIELPSPLQNLLTLMLIIWLNS